MTFQEPIRLIDEKLERRMTEIAAAAADQRVLILRDALREVLAQRDERIAALENEIAALKERQSRAADDTAEAERDPKLRLN